MTNLAIHLRQGFYANALFDKLVGAYQLERKHKALQRSLSDKPTERQSESRQESMAS